MKRLFLAIKFIPDIELLRIYSELKQSLSHDKIRWVDPQNFHLTLKFFGSTPEDKIQLISRVVNDTVKSYNTLNLKIENIGIFGSRYKPRVIWFGITRNDQLIKLGNELLNNLNDVGFLRDRQNFVPHLTVGRIISIEDKALFNKKIQQFKNVFIQEFEIHELLLYERILKPAGPEYYKIESFPLIL